MRSFFKKILEDMLSQNKKINEKEEDIERAESRALIKESSKSQPRIVAVH